MRSSSIADLQKLVPIASVIEIKPGTRYLMQLNRRVSPETINCAQEVLRERGFPDILVVDSEFTIYDLGAPARES
jgi:hypothetical protein